jgi:hypothetical protein
MCTGLYMKSCSAFNYLHTLQACLFVKLLAPYRSSVMLCSLSCGQFMTEVTTESGKMKEYVC